MSTASEQSKVMAIFCQNEAKKGKNRVHKTWLEKVALQGVMVALLEIVSQSSSGYKQQRSNGWMT
jgi:hypothetical protein